MGELENRRHQFFNLLPDNSVALVFSGVSKIRSEDEFYDFHANRNFFYLTGIEQENSVAMFIKCPGEKKIYLFLDEYNELKERWTGKRLTFEEASRISSLSNVYSNQTFEQMLQMSLSNNNNIYDSQLPVNSNLTESLSKLITVSSHPHVTDVLNSIFLSYFLPSSSTS